MRKTLFMLIIILMISFLGLGIFTACGGNEEEQGEQTSFVFETSEDGTFYTVTGYDGEETEVEIPSSYSELPVKAISKHAFKGKTITKIVIPDSIETIGLGAFYNCTNLANVSLGQGLTAISGELFAGCSSLVEITIPNGVLTLGAKSFYSCTNLESVKLGSGLTEIGVEAFSKCTKLSSVEFSNGVTMICRSAFSGCASLNNIIIPESVTTIEKEAFFGCSNLQNITINGKLSFLGSRMFDDCHQSLYTEEENLVYVKINENPYALLNKNTNDSLYTYSINENTEYVGTNVFANCKLLKNIIIPDSVTVIGDYCFNNCGSLKNVTIGSGVKIIGESAFATCGSLESIVIPDNVERLGGSIFTNCSTLKDVKIGKGVKSIGPSAFYSCAVLEEIFIPINVEAMEGVGMFADCYNLKKVYVEASGKPSGWNRDWAHRCYGQVIWGYQG